MTVLPANRRKSLANCHRREGTTHSSKVTRHCKCVWSLGELDIKARTEISDRQMPGHQKNYNSEKIKGCTKLLVVLAMDYTLDKQDKQDVATPLMTQTSLDVIHVLNSFLSCKICC